MQKNGTLAIISVVTGTIVGAYALVKRTFGLANKNAEANANAQGGVDALQQKRQDQLRKASDQPSPAAFNHQVEHINDEFYRKKNELVHKPATFSEAWKLLNNDQKTKTLAFSLVTGVGVGAVTYGVGYLMTRPSKGGGGGSSNDSDYGGYYYGPWWWGDGGGGHHSGDGHHGGSGHHSGGDHGGGFGFDGGGYGGHGGGFGFDGGGHGGHGV